MATIEYEVVAVIHTEGRDKPKYIRCGSVYRNEKGLSLKLDSLPTAAVWDGWLSLFRPRDEAKPASAAPPKAEAPLDDRLPF